MYQRKVAKMDLDKILRHVGNLNDYIAATQEVAKRESSSSKVQFNMSTVLLLKKVRSLEIEYFNKCEGNGAALVLFERMVEQPASKTWGLLGKELVLLLQYWLDAIRKHLIKHNHHWWSFLKLLLKIIKSIRTKDPTLPDVLVEGTTECLLDLATSSQPDILQRHEILCCLNLFGAESSREIRFALRNKFETYFTKLATFLTSCGHLPSQYSALETLLRWLLPRQSASLRAAAARKWFPEDVCGRDALELFLDRPWQDFYQDARDFLNACNNFADLITSVVCRKVTVGDVAVVLGTEKRATWLDINSDRSLSVILDVRLLDALGLQETGAWETLVVPEEDVISVQLYKESSEVHLVVHTGAAPRLRPAAARLPGAELRLVLSSASHLARLDRALRRGYEHKYQVSLNLDSQISMSPQEYRENHKRIQNSLEEDTRFSHPVEIHRRKHSGFIVRTRNPVSFQSPSTASTSSLAQLHEKLESLPQYKFDKEAVHVCALPELSTVTEVSETDDRQSLLSQTLKIPRAHGVCQKKNRIPERHSQSDGEVQDKARDGRYLSPIEKDDEKSTNCLLVATIGSADESVINDTLERLTKNKDFRSDNIVDLLVQEALQKDFNDRELQDSGINTGDNTKKTQYFNEVNSEAIENTPFQKLDVYKTVSDKEKKDVFETVTNTHKIDDSEAVSKKEKIKTCTVISNTTTNESNDVVCETPKNFVTVRRRFPRTKVIKEKENIILEEPDEIQIFNVKDVEDFFSQHVAENKRGEIVISPTLARKINETSSESEQFEDCLMIHEDQDRNYNVEQIELQDIEVVECLNSMVDKVCSDFERCAEILKRDTKEMDVIEESNNAPIENPPDIIPLTDVSHLQNVVSDKENVESNKPKTKKSIKLKYTAKKTTKTAKSRSTKKKNKLELESALEVSPIKEKIVDNAQNIDKTPERPHKAIPSPKTDSPASKSMESDTPLLRRKRKLYSPKYENIESEKIYKDKDDDEQAFKSSKVQTPIYKSTCYKEIETERKKKIRQPRTRKSKAKFDTQSPRTKRRNDMFDQLKEKVECPVTVVSKAEREAMYNFTSDSDDKDFKKKKIEVQKRISSTTIASCDSALSTRKGRSVNRVNYSENRSSDETLKKSASKQKRAVRRKRTPRKRLAKPVNEIIDEKMRKADRDELNTSMIAAKGSETISEEPLLVLAANPKMEVINDEVVIEIKEINDVPRKANKKQKKAEVLSLKKEKNGNLNTLIAEQDNDDRTISPLPGLVIETMPDRVEDANDSVSANMLQKLKKIHENGPEEFINETNTTHNLLSDVERTNYSQQMNITEEFNNYENDDTKIADENSRSSLQNMIAKNMQSNLNSTNILRVKKEMAEKDKRKIRSQTPVINLSDTKSEKSIATVGKSPITAHGDSDEAPPHSDLLTENLKPRDLDIEYLDQSMKEYFNKLRREVDELPEKRDSNESVSTKVLRNIERESSTEKSPVVSIKRLSYDDISKWLPSPRHSDSDSRSSEEYVDEIKTNKVKENKMKRIQKELSDQELNKSKITEPKADKSLDVEKSIKRSKRGKTKVVTKLLKYTDNEDILNNETNLEITRHNSSNSKWLRSHGDIEPHNSSDEYNIGEPTRASSDKSEVTSNAVKKSKKNKRFDETQANRKSMISPIKFFDEIVCNEKQESPILRQSSRQKAIKDRQSSILRHESPIVKQKSSSIKQESEIKRAVSKEKQHSSSDEEKCIDKKMETSSRKNKQKKSGRGKAAKIKSPEIQNIDDEMSMRKRKSDSPEIGFPKRRKCEDVVTISQSGPSVSSVDEWFRRNVPVGRGESMDTSLRDSVNTVLEKLDTTLAEIHQSTSKKFVHLFVDAQSHLAAMRRERRDMFKAVAADLLTQLVSVVDDKFAELDRRSEDMHSQFTERLKAQAAELVREDGRRKRLMVSLLREDLTATLARRGREN